jgi:hypothetical protein
MFEAPRMREEEAQAGACIRCRRRMGLAWGSHGARMLRAGHALVPLMQARGGEACRCGAWYPSSYSGGTASPQAQPGCSSHRHDVFQHPL